MVACDDLSQHNVARNTQETSRPALWPRFECARRLARYLRGLLGIRNSVMRAAIPLYGHRVSPRFAFSERTLVADISDGSVANTDTIDAAGLTDRQRLEQLSALGIDVFVCGAVDPEFLSEAGSLDIRIIPDVAAESAEVLELLAQGRLLPGHGTYADPSVAASEQAIDCVVCLDRVCLSGKGCPHVIPELHCPAGSTQSVQTLDVATDIAWETERQLCRVAEFVHFCHGMKYEHVGVAFCVDLFRETQILTHLLRRYVRVTPVCCKIGGELSVEPEYVPSGARAACNPLGQAAELNRARVDINAIVGLCMGCDVLFARHSLAPVTTLFVKDRLLANNPVGALYSHYYLKELVDQTRMPPDAAGLAPRQGVSP